MADLCNQGLRGHSFASSGVVDLEVPSSKPFGRHLLKLCPCSFLGSVSLARASLNHWCSLGVGEPGVPGDGNAMRSAGGREKTATT